MMMIAEYIKRVKETELPLISSVSAVQDLFDARNFVMSITSFNCEVLLSHTGKNTLPVLKQTI